MSFFHSHPLLFPSRALFPVLLLPIAVSAACFGQTFNAGIRGSVQDASGATVPGAVVTLTDEGTHQTRETQTDGAGIYALNALRPATYSLHVAASTFGPADRTGIAVATQDFVTLDIRLSASDATKTVQVSADAPLVDSPTAPTTTGGSARRPLVHPPCF